MSAPLTPGDAVIWQPPYSNAEQVTILRVAATYRRGRIAYAVRCHDGERIAYSEDLRPVPPPAAFASEPCDPAERWVDPLGES